MPHSILFVQGAGAGTHDDWDVKLVRSLEGGLDGCDIRYPRMPNEDDPTYSAWKGALLDEFSQLDDGAVLVGHSIGGTILVNVLAEEQPAFAPAALILIAAPFVGDGGWTSDEIATPADLAERLPAGMPVFLYHGAEDEIAPVAHAGLYATLIPQAVVRILPGRDHQLNDDLGEVARDILSLARLAT